MALGSALLLLAAWQPPLTEAPSVGQPRIVPDGRCGPSRRPDEIVVCGGPADGDSRYRLPEQFRAPRSDEDRHASIDPLFRDQESLHRFENQTDGPFGIYRHSLQVDCEWRVARQELRGERPDCGTGLRF